MTSAGKCLPGSRRDHTSAACRSLHRMVRQDSGSGETETGSADAAKGLACARRRFVVRQKVLTCQPTKIVGVYLCVSSERHSVKPSAHRVMAIAHIGKRTIHLVTHCAAKTTALYCHVVGSSCLLPAIIRASSPGASIAPRTTSAHGPPAWAVPRTRIHRSIPVPATPAGASRLP
jgi:hypothetical protein